MAVLQLSGDYWSQPAERQRLRHGDRQADGKSVRPQQQQADVTPRRGQKSHGR